MRAAVSCALALLVAGALHATSSAAAAAADQSGDHKRPKASSFAPHAGAHGRVYGTPIQPTILKSRPKKAPQLKKEPQPTEPQLKSSPLPDSQPAPAQPPAPSANTSPGK
jgi:hypothetical protein